MQTAADGNRLRFRSPGRSIGVLGRERTRGHVESYFLRANHPQRRLAMWLKCTIFHAPAEDPDPVAELWGIVFDGERGRVWAARETVSYASTRFAGTAGSVELAGARFRFGEAGTAVGELHDCGGGPAHRRLAWDLAWSVPASSLARPLCLLPSQLMVDGPFPRSKLLTPFPLLRVRGHLDVWGERLELDDWVGMQGHNWGREHAWEYAWGQCHFSDPGGEPFCSVEGFSGRIRLAGLVSPLLSGMVVRRGEREWRFDRIFDTWRQQAEIGDSSWTLSMRGPGGDAWLEMTARPEETVCLGYRNPDGRLSHCFNSKLARVRLRVNPVNEEGFSCTSEHGGALELLRNEPDPRFAVV